MTRVVAYSRGDWGAPGNQGSLPYWRRLTLPFTVLEQQRWFTSFQTTSLDRDDTLTKAMLLGPQAVLFQNFIPKPEEVEIFTEASLSAHLSGNWLSWCYDLEDPTLLENPQVVTILPMMRVITVPNAYLQREIFSASRAFFQRIEVLPSTFDIAWLRTSVQLRSRPVPLEEASFEKENAPFLISCFGPHDWEQLLPVVFSLLVEQLPFEYVARVCIQTDSPDVQVMCRDAHLPCLLIDDRPLTVAAYPAYLARSHVALCPREGEDSRDTCWLAEFSATECPVICAAHSSYDQPELRGSGAIILDLSQPKQWAETLARWIMTREGEEERKTHAKLAYHWGLDQRVQSVIGRYSKLYRQILPASIQ